MKRSLLFLFILIMLFTSCTKEKKSNNIDLSLVYPVYEYDKSNDIEIDSKYKVVSSISDNYFIVKNDENKYNFMDLNGNLLLKDFYLKLGNFSDGLAPVIEGKDLEDRENIKRYYINTKGEKVIEKVNDIDLFSNNEFKYGIASVGLKENPSEFKGICNIDTNGNIVSVGIPKLENVYLNLFKKIVYKNGKTLNKFGLSQAFVTLDDYNKDDTIFYLLGDLFGLYDKNKDEILTQPLYSLAFMQPFVNDKIYVVKENHKNDNLKLILLDKSGKELKKINKYGKLKKETKKLSNNSNITSYNISKINNNKIVANFDKASVVLNMEGNEVLKSKYRNLLSVEENEMISFYDENTGKYGLINLNDELILKDYDKISNIYNNTILLTKDGKTVIHKFK